MCPLRNIRLRIIGLKNAENDKQANACIRCDESEKCRSILKGPSEERLKLPSRSLDHSKCEPYTDVKMHTVRMVMIRYQARISELFVVLASMNNVVQS